MSDTTDLFKRFGGEVKQTIKGATLTNTQDNFTPASQGSERIDLNEPDNLKGISSAEFNIIVAYFSKKGVPEALARTYGASIIEASLTTGRDVTDIINLNKGNFPATFDNDVLTHLNLFRSKTSQVGYKTANVSEANQLLKRTII